MGVAQKQWPATSAPFHSNMTPWVFMGLVSQKTKLRLKTIFRGDSLLGRSNEYEVYGVNRPGFE